MLKKEPAEIRVAVIDDEKMILDVFSSLMRQCGYKADFFSDPRVAMDTIISNPGHYDLVVADIKMPEMDGITFAKKVRFVIPDLPVIFMTGGVSDEIREEAMRLNKVLFLEKPFPLDSTLKNAISKLLS